MSLSSNSAVAQMRMRELFEEFFGSTLKSCGRGQWQRWDVIELGQLQEWDELPNWDM
jgi:hypothetical protein